MPKYCSKCNQPNPDEAAFCLNCAAPISAPPPFVGQPPAQQWQGSGAATGGTPNSAGTGSSQKALVALILAIAALLCCGPFTGVPAAILGWMELEAIKNGRSPQDGRWMALVGLWGGIASTIIHAGFYVLWVLMTMMSAASNPYGY